MTTTVAGGGLSLRGVSIRIPLPGTPRRWVHAARDLDLDVTPGRITAVVGESGCGKSVLGLAAMGLLPPGTRTAGSIHLGDVDLLAAGEGTLRAVRGGRIGLIPQSAATHLTPVRVVGSLLRETLVHHRLPAGRNEIAALLDRVGLPAAVATHYPHELSGGMAQRVLVALTLALRPMVLVADEPTSALDPATTDLILAAITDHARSGGAVVLITHDLVAAAGVADDVAVMYAGRLLEVGPARLVLQEPAHDYSRALLAALPVNGMRPPPGTPSSLVDSDPDVCAWHLRAGVPCPATGLRTIAAGHRVACRAGVA